MKDATIETHIDCDFCNEVAPLVLRVELPFAWDDLWICQKCMEAGLTKLKEANKPQATQP